MALGPTTYKTPNIISFIKDDFTNLEGCGARLHAANTVALATSQQDVPYAVVVVGAAKNGAGTQPIEDAALELVDQLGCAVQVLISSNAAVVAGEFLVIDSANADGTFTGTNSQPPAQGDWLWGYALTDADAGQQCLMRFQPQYAWYVAP